MLFGFYPRNEANDPEMFIAGATATLAAYPETVVERVCDPVRGLPSKSRFLPAIAEIREACERELVWHDAVERRDRDRRHTPAPLAPPPLITPEDRRRVREYADRVLAELKARGEPPGAIDFRPPRSPVEAEAARRHFEARLPGLAAEYAANPPTMSGQLREKHLEAFAAERYEDEGSRFEDREFLP